MKTPEGIPDLGIQQITSIEGLLTHGLTFIVPLGLSKASARYEEYS